MAFVNYTRADAWPVPTGQPDIASLLGHWINTKRDTDYIAELIVSAPDGVLRVQLFGTSEDGLIDWGETAATPYVSGKSLEAGGFLARYDLGTNEAQIAANQKLGVLVIQLYTSFKDGSERPNHFSREFFCRRGGRQ